MWSDETHIELWRGFRHGLRVRRSSSISRYDPRFIRRSVKHPPQIDDLGGVWQWKARPAVLRGEEPKDECRDVPVSPPQASQGQPQADRVLRVYAGRGALSHCPQHQGVVRGNDIEVLDWVGQSCDLNLIENLWRGLNGIIGRMPACSNFEKLTKQIKKVWAKLGKNKEFLRNLTNSMPARIEAFIEADGDVTKN